MTQKTDLSSALDLLATVSKGKATVSVEGAPVAHLDADKRTLEVDANGLRATGLNIWDLVGKNEGMFAALTGPLHIANEMAERGWVLTVYVGREKVLTMGSGMSRLTGRIGLSPLKTRKLLKALR